MTDEVLGDIVPHAVRELPMRLTCVVLTLSGLAFLAGCSSQRKPPYANDPLLTHYKPTLSDSTSILAEKQMRRGPTKPPMPMVGGDAARTERPIELKPPPSSVQPIKMEQLELLPPPPVSEGGPASPPITAATGNLPPLPITLPKRPDSLPPAFPPMPTTNKPDPPPALPPTRKDYAEASRSLPPPESAPPLPPTPQAELSPPEQMPSLAPPPAAAPEPTPNAPLAPVNEPAAQFTPSMPATELPKAQTPELAATPIDPPKEPEPTSAKMPKQRRVVAADFGVDPDYHWVQGVLDRHFRGHCSVRYCDPSQDDVHGGKVRLQDDERLTAFADGDIIGMEGELVLRNEDGHSSPRYLIRDVWLVRKKQTQP